MATVDYLIRFLVIDINDGPFVEVSYLVVPYQLRCERPVYLRPCVHREAAYIRTVHVIVKPQRTTLRGINDRAGKAGPIPLLSRGR